MSTNRERAEAHARPRMTETDRRQYTGVARHPLARRWLLKRLSEAQERAEAADSATARQRWRLEVERVNGELRRCGVGLEGER